MSARHKGALSHSDEVEETSLSFSTFLTWASLCQLKEQPVQVSAAADRVPAVLQIPADSNPHSNVGFVILLQAHKAFG